MFETHPPLILYCYPRMQLDCTMTSLQDFGLSSGSLINIDCNNGDFDPLLEYDLGSIPEQVHTYNNYVIIIM